MCAAWIAGGNTLGGVLVFGTLGGALVAVSVGMYVFSGGVSVAREKFLARCHRADNCSSVMG